MSCFDLLKINRCVFTNCYFGLVYAGTTSFSIDISLVYGSTLKFSLIFFKHFKIEKPENYCEKTITFVGLLRFLL